MVTVKKLLLPLASLLVAVNLAAVTPSSSRASSPAPADQEHSATTPAPIHPEESATQITQATGSETEDITVVLVNNDIVIDGNVTVADSVVEAKLSSPDTNNTTTEQRPAVTQLDGPSLVSLITAVLERHNKKSTPASLISVIIANSNIRVKGSAIWAGSITKV